MNISKRRLDDLQDIAYQNGLTYGKRTGHEAALKDAQVKRGSDIVEAKLKALNALSQALSAAAHLCDNLHGVL